MTKQAIDAVTAWRALEPCEKMRIRQSVVIDRVVASMAMEGEPVSQKWINQAKARRAQPEASTPPEVHQPTRSCCICLLSESPRRVRQRQAASPD